MNPELDLSPLTVRMEYLEKTYDDLKRMAVKNDDEIKEDIRLKHEKYNRIHSQLREDMKSIPVLSAKMDYHEIILNDMKSDQKDIKDSLIELVDRMNQNSISVHGAKGVAKGIEWSFTKILVVAMLISSIIFEILRL